MSQENPPLFSTYFVISGRDFDPDSCSEALGLQPTKIWRQKSPHLRDRRDLATVEWQIGFERRPLYSMDEAVAEVLDIIWPVRGRLRDFLGSRKDLSAAIVCNATIRDDRPEYCLSSSVLEKIASISCEFCLDIFDYSD